MPSSCRPRPRSNTREHMSSSYRNKSRSNHWATKQNVFPKAVAGSTGHAGGSSRSGGNCSRSGSREQQQQQQQQHQQRERETSQAPCGLVCLWRARNHTRPTRVTAPLSLPHQWPHTQLGGLGLGFRDFGTFGCRPVKTGDQSPTTPKIPGFLVKNTRNLENSP